MRDALAASLIFALATLLLASAIAKAVAPARARDAIRALGAPRRLSSIAVASGVVFEWLLAVSLTLAPRSLFANAALVALFGVFAVLGGWALLRGKVVRCGCFGSVRSAPLGGAQLYQFVAVTASSLWVLRHGPRWTFSESLAALLLIHVTAAAALLASATQTLRRIRRDRISLAAGRAFAFAAPPDSPRGEA